MQKKIIVIGGPTASGKTAFAVHLAKKHNGELINADSRQIYKYLNIGTNKGKLKENNGIKTIDDVPIRIIDFLELNERYNLFQYKEAALNSIEEIFKKEHLPILVGGTGLYIDSVLRDYSIETEVSDLAKRSKLEKLSIEELKAKFFQISTAPKLNNSDLNNPRRLIRLIEKFDKGIDLNNKSSQFTTKFDFVFYYPKYNLEDLKTRIEFRVEEMFKEGLIEETENALKLFSKDSIPFKGIGYKEVIDFLDGKFNLKETIKQVQLAHIKYAKRQIIWFEGKGRNYPLTTNSEWVT